jgi:hypothetical protein
MKVKGAAVTKNPLGFRITGHFKAAIGQKGKGQEMERRGKRNGRGSRILRP